MKNNKGFTLIELLAVIVILVAISTIAISSISAAIERNKVKQNDAKIAVIVSRAELYYQEHKNSMGARKCIGINDLNLSEAEVTTVDGDPISGVIRIDNSGVFTFDKNGTC